ncbi:isochorismatase family protein [Paucibacter sp. APW11]|uniref:Isochorismatase family protein n=1 Tax=Roseateles aquae TaxID=3077235 RepID=A0ABU3PDF0_9BURK|nr:isochorismatase family protein [Paucibacter sp. APW11]MDT9000580.1 isochorismatase family protein [Paucibacter sp. APW11]
MKTALIVIDVQESFRQRPYWNEADYPAYIERNNALIAGAEQLGLPIVRIFHNDGPETADNPFALASGHVRQLAELRAYTPAAEFIKHRHSALSGTGLSIWLHQQGIQRLIISGIRTEQCCETTTRHASDEGWTVDYVTEATLTFAMTHKSGAVLSPADIKLRTETMLQDRFADIVSVEQALQRARRALDQV